MPPAQPIYYTAPQAAALLGISNATLHRAVRRGLIVPCFKTPGGNLRFQRAEIDRYRSQSLQISRLRHQRE